MLPSGPGPLVEEQSASFGEKDRHPKRVRRLALSGWTWLARRWREIGLTLVLLAGAAFFTILVDRVYPLRDWLFFRYAGYFLLAGAFLLASTSAGLFVLGRVLGFMLPLGEHLVLASATGVLCFGLGWFVIGALGLYSTAAFVLWPALLLAIGARRGFRLVRGLVRHRRRSTLPRSLAQRMGAFGLIALGVVGLGLVYLPILTPHNVAYDARWYHLAIAEGYAVSGGVFKFDHGWYIGTYPHLASFLYAWAFCLPTERLFHHVGVATHLEFILFLVTLAQIPVLVRRLLGGGRHPLAWVAMFAFPGLFLYDSSLSGAADHVAAFWAIPLYLAMLRTYRDLDRRFSLLLGMLIAAPLLTKYSAYGMVLFPAAAVALRALTFAVKRKRWPGQPPRAFWQGPILAALVALVATTPHWLKNLVLHGDPFYPLGHTWFPSRPWTVDTLDGFHFAFEQTDFLVEHTFAGALKTLGAAVTFSFSPNDWTTFHGQTPVFGSLFTLSIPCLLFLRRPWRLVALYGCAHVAILFWYWTFHQDRYLQAYLPWMAAGIAAVAIRTWKAGIGPRCAVLVISAAQLIWGGDVPFIPTHAMTSGTSPYKLSIDLLSTGYRQKRGERFDDYGYKDMRKALPRGAVLLLHEEQEQLGLGAKVVSDWTGYQGGVSYGRSPAPDQMYDLLSSMGVSHLAWVPGRSRAFDSVGGDIAFFNFALRYAKPARNVSGFLLAEMPAARPMKGSFKDRALLLTCGKNQYLPGLYSVTDLTVTVLSKPRPTSDYPLPRTALDPRTVDVAAYSANVDAIIYDQGCARPENAPRDGSFILAATRGSYEIWIPLSADGAR